MHQCQALRTTPRPPTRRLWRTTSVLAALALATIAAPHAARAALSTETITMNWTRSGTPPTPPYTGTGDGTFSAVGGPVTTSGSLAIHGQDVAVASPVLAAARTDRFLTSSPQDTLELRCFEQATDFSNPAAIPFTGSCTIVAGTGIYSSLHGHGNFATAVVDPSTGQVSETLVLKVS
jgi:hypothetical protein